MGAERVVAILADGGRRRSTASEAGGTARGRTRRWVGDALPIRVRVVARAATSQNRDRPARNDRWQSAERRHGAECDHHSKK
jgi:hypothetical protein